MNRPVIPQLGGREVILLLLSGLLLSLSFLTLNLSFLIWIGIIPLFFAIEGKAPKQAFVISYLTGLLFFLFSMYWLIYVTPCGWIVLSLYQALYIGIFGASASYFASKGRWPVKNYIFVPSLWTVLEYSRSHIGGGIGWNLLGYSQYENIPLIQIADITGVYGVSFLVVLVNFSIYSAIRMAIRCQRTHKRLFAKSDLAFREEARINPIFQTFAVFAVVAIVLLYGYNKIARLDEENKGLYQFKVSVIQGNIPQHEKWEEAYADKILKRYRGLTEKAAGNKPDLIVWPETSLPGYVEGANRLYVYLQGLAYKVWSPLLVGAPMHAGEAADITSDYNSAVLFSKKGELLQQYNKLHLVAFGEFIPFEESLPFLRRFFPLTGDFKAGDKYTLFSLIPAGEENSISFGVLICFEDIFPHLVRNFIKRNVDFMVNITNDAWFGRTAAPYQHTANSVFRAIEARRPFVRSANTGISCLIDSTGRVRRKVSRGGRDIFVGGYATGFIGVDRDAALSFYTIYGDIFTRVCFLFMALFVIDYIRSHGYNKKSR